MAQRNEIFSRLLKAAISSIATCEGKTIPAIEEDIGTQIGVSGATIERYKGGQVPIEPERIKVLAESAIRRGLLGREWLQRFLHVARYHATDQLLEQLTPLGAVRPRPPRVYENLPAPTYSQFVMREQAFADVLDGLQQRSAVVLIVGLGGNGKTSLAREIASMCLKDGNEPRFDAVVWISDKDQPGTTNFTTVLDEVARTLDYPGFTQFEHEEKRHEVEQLLRRQRVLLVVDNFETVTDGALLTWLLRLPEPSKALITSRERHRGLWSSWLAELRGMSDIEAQTLIAQRLRVLQLQTLVKDLAEFEPLVAVTGGNPKAIEIAIGLVKYEQRSLQQVVEDLYAARGEMFEDLFARAWSLLDEAARRVLLVMTFFPTSVGNETLAATADAQSYSFERAVERLTDLALLDVQQVDLAKEARYVLHPLVRVFVGARLKEQVEFEEAARKRWITWYFAVIDKASDRWHELAYLWMFDNEADNVESTITWMFEKQRFSDVLSMSDILGYYYYVRGFWHKQEALNRLRIRAAQQLGDGVAETKSLLNLVRVSIFQDDVSKSQYLLREIEKVLDRKLLRDQEGTSFRHSSAIFAMLNKDFHQAEMLFRKNIAEAEYEHQFTLNRSRSWLADCLYQQGKLDEAKSLFELSLQESKKLNYLHTITFCEVRLASMALDQNKDEQAEELLQASHNRAQTYQDRRELALIYKTNTRLHILRGDFPAARTALAEAIDLFERLGMRRELTKARQALVDLDVSATPSLDQANIYQRD